MIEGPLKEGDEVRHIKTGGIYRVYCPPSYEDDEGKTSETLLKVGDGEADDSTTEHPGWIPAVVYYDPMNADNNYVRDEKTFRQRFERV